MEHEKILIAADSGIAIRSAKDVSDAVSACFGAKGLVITESELVAEFFDLRTGLAGEVMQKFVNYRKRVAIVVADLAAHGDRFSELALEHRHHDLIRFVSTTAEGVAWLRAGTAVAQAGLVE